MYFLFPYLFIYLSIYSFIIYLFIHFLLLDHLLFKILLIRWLIKLCKFTLVFSVNLELNDLVLLQIKVRVFLDAIAGDFNIVNIDLDYT